MLKDESADPVCQRIAFDTDAIKLACSPIFDMLPNKDSFYPIFLSWVSLGPGAPTSGAKTVAQGHIAAVAGNAPDGGMPNKIRPVLSISFLNECSVEVQMSRPLRVE